MHIRPYADDDLEALLDVWLLAARSAYSFLPDDFFETERQQIADRWIPIAETTVAEIDGHLVGFLSLIGNEVGAIFVDPNRQGNGVGRALMDRARDSRPVLELNVFEANQSGRGFYAAYGFEVIGRHVHEGTGHAELRLRLAGTASDHGAPPGVPAGGGE